MWRRLLPIPVSFCLFLLRHPVFTTLFIYIALVALHPPPRRPGLSEKEEEKDVDFLSTSSCVCKLVPIFPLHFLPPFLLLLCLLPTSFFFAKKRLLLLPHPLRRKFASACFHALCAQGEKQLRQHRSNTLHAKTSWFGLYGVLSARENSVQLWKSIQH